MLMERNNTKTALVTGAASGLGFELAFLLAKDMYHLILIDIDSEKLEQAKESILKTHQTKITLMVKDLSLVNIAQEIYNDIGHTVIDVIINNAGRIKQSKPISSNICN